MKATFRNLFLTAAFSEPKYALERMLVLYESEITGAANDAFVESIDSNQLSKTLNLLRFSPKPLITLNREQIAQRIASISIKEFVKNEIRKESEDYYEDEDNETAESTELQELLSLFPEARERVIGGARHAYEDAVQKADLRAMRIINDRFDVDPRLKQLTETFGDNLTVPIYRVSIELLDGKITSEAREIGITKTGREGIGQLSEVGNEIIRSHLSRDAQSAERLLSSPLLSDVFKYAVRYEQSEWGEHGDSSFKNTLRVYEKTRKNGEIEALPWYLSESQVMQIPLRERARVPLSESAINRYETLRTSLRNAFTHLESNKKPLSSLATLLEDGIQTIVSDLENKRQATEREEARIGIDKRISQLKSIEVRSVEHFQETVRVLGQFPELHDTMREVIFLYVLARHREVRGRAQNVTEQDASVQTISNLLEFVDHIVNQETFSEYFTDKKSADTFRWITSVKAFEEELQRTQKLEAASTETVPVKFVPTRGLLAEFSGHIADACWASRYDSVLEAFPTISHVMLVKHPGDPQKEKIIGACLLIETISDKDEHVLVIRGLNPQESEINKLSIPDFVSAFTGWVKEVATEDGRIPAIVIDDHAGGATTNRPKLHTYLQSIESSLERVQLHPERQYEGAGGWVFNGYNQIDTASYRV